MKIYFVRDGQGFHKEEDFVVWLKTCQEKDREIILTPSRDESNQLDNTINVYEHHDRKEEGFRQISYVGSLLIK